MECMDFNVKLLKGMLKIHLAKMNSCKNFDFCRFAKINFLNFATFRNYENFFRIKSILLVCSEKNAEMHSAGEVLGKLSHLLLGDICKKHALQYYC